MTVIPASLDATIDEMRPVTARFEAAGHRLYLVGGVVRDHMLGRVGDGIDIDATTDARPETIKALLADLAEVMWTQGQRFGTIGIVLAGCRYEITTHRAEVYEQTSRKPAVEFGDDVIADLGRRDFTVNAMAVDLSTRRLVDPFDGLADLERSVLRTPLGPEVSFHDDPLRMLRTARFHAGYGLEPTEALLDAITAMLDRMAIVSVERVRDELQRLLLLAVPGRGLALLAGTGLLACVIPALGDTVADPARRSAMIARVDAAAKRPMTGCVAAGRSPDPDPARRWAALLWDTERPGAEMAALRASSALRRSTEWFLTARTLPDALDDSELRRLAAGAPSGRCLEDLLGFAGRLEETRDRLRALRLAEPDLDDPVAPLDGTEVAAELGIRPGPAVGEALGFLSRCRQLGGPLTTDEARAALHAWWADRGA